MHTLNESECQPHHRECLIHESNKQEKQSNPDYAFTTLILFFIAFFFSSFSSYSSILAFFSGDMRSIFSRSSFIFCSFIACIL